MKFKFYYHCMSIISFAIYSIWFYVGISIITNDYSILSYVIPWICFIALSFIFACIIGRLIASHIYRKK